VADHRLSSRSLTIAGGTTQINKNVTAVRVLAQEDDLELTAEQVALRTTVRAVPRREGSVATHVQPLLDDATGSTAQVWSGLAVSGRRRWSPTNSAARA
jgi:hypothetical protein